MKDKDLEYYNAIERKVLQDLGESDSGYAFMLHECDDDKFGLTFFIQCVDSEKMEYIGLSELIDERLDLLDCMHEQENLDHAESLANALISGLTRAAMEIGTKLNDIKGNIQ